MLCSSWLDSASSFQHVKLLYYLHHRLFLTYHHYATILNLQLTTCFQWQPSFWVLKIFFHDDSWVLNMKAKRIMGHTTKSNTTRFHTSGQNTMEVSTPTREDAKVPKSQVPKQRPTSKGDVFSSLLSCISHLYNISSTSSSSRNRSLWKNCSNSNSRGSRSKSTGRSTY